MNIETTGASKSVVSHSEFLKLVESTVVRDLFSVVYFIHIETQVSYAGKFGGLDEFNATRSTNFVVSKIQYFKRYELTILCDVFDTLIGDIIA